MAEQVRLDEGILELENQGLRVQNDLQQKAIDSMEKELRYLRRFKNLVDRAGEVVDKLVVNL